MSEENICKGCERIINQEFARHQGKPRTCMSYGCDLEPNNCSTRAIVQYVLNNLERIEED